MQFFLKKHKTLQNSEVQGNRCVLCEVIGHMVGKKLPSRIQEGFLKKKKKMCPKQQKKKLLRNWKTLVTEQRMHRLYFSFILLLREKGQ